MHTDYKVPYLIDYKVAYLENGQFINVNGHAGASLKPCCGGRRNKLEMMKDFPCFIRRMMIDPNPTLIQLIGLSFRKTLLGAKLVSLNLISILPCKSCKSAIYRSVNWQFTR